MTQLTESLKGINVTVIDAAAGTAFDPNFHNAVMHVEDENLGENVIAETFQQGFQIGDKVIRHAMVKCDGEGCFSSKPKHIIRIDY